MKSADPSEGAGDDFNARSASFQLPSGTEIVLDLSRLISRMLHSTPTGVDRVEMAYARTLRQVWPDQLSFSAVNPLGTYGRLSSSGVADFLDETDALWNGSQAAPSNRLLKWLRALKWGRRLRPQRIPRKTGRRILIQTSPHHLHNEPLVASILRREQASFVCLIHDLIPIEYPEYARPGGSSRHLRRIQTVVRHAVAVIANSAATARSVQPYLTGREVVPLHVACLGQEQEVGSIDAPSLAGDRPYFVCLGTIEARKNHLLLLNIWRRLAEERERSDPPLLIIIGRRGWENEQVLDMLDRCPSLRGHVEERNGLTDEQMRGLLKGANALLLPSFAEGYGMPVPEALAVGVPVICSDLPALREAGGDVPDYLDPLDGVMWVKYIRDHAEKGPLHQQQLVRMKDWRPWTWNDHFEGVCHFIQMLLKQTR